MDLDTLTLEGAREIYRVEYWGGIRGHELPRSIQIALFDWAVHSGPDAAIRGLQRALGVQVDGVFGPMTWKALLAAPGAWWGDPQLLQELLHDRAAQLGAIVRRDASQLDFIVGWTRRLIDVALASRG